MLHVGAAYHTDACASLVNELEGAWEGPGELQLEFCPLSLAVLDDIICQIQQVQLATGIGYKREQDSVATISL